jgi:formylmethanofuran dehydrogenase subunit E
MTETADHPLAVPPWAFSFQGHRCMCMPLGYRAGAHAMDLLGVDRERDYGTFVFSELSDDDSSGCFDDGVQIATGATYGKGLYRRLAYGKLAITLHRPGVGAVRVHVRNDFLERLTGGIGKGFLELRSQGVSPSAMPDDVIVPILDFLGSEPSDAMFEHEFVRNFVFKPGVRAMTRRRCTQCGEYTFEAEGVAIGDSFSCRACYLSIAAPTHA